MNEVVTVVVTVVVTEVVIVAGTEVVGGIEDCGSDRGRDSGSD